MDIKIYLSSYCQSAGLKEVLHSSLLLEVFAIKDLNQFFYFQFFLPSPLTEGKVQGIRISRAEELSD